MGNIPSTLGLKSDVHAKGAPVETIYSDLPQFYLLNAHTDARFNGNDRFNSYITTDKPIYKPGDVCFVRVVILNAFTHAMLR